MYFKKICLLISFVLSIFIIRVNASTINYNLNIDNNRHFYETITYTIENNSDNDYLKNILSKPVYYDYNQTMLYNKKVSKDNDNTIVVLKKDYDNNLFKYSSILNECYENIGFDVDDYRISFYTKSYFKCSNRADNIVVSVTTSIPVMNNNANIIENNSYIWTQIDKIPILQMEIGEIDPSSGDLPPIECDNCTNKYVPLDKENVGGNDIKHANILIIMLTLIIIIITIILAKRHISSKTETENIFN